MKKRVIVYLSALIVVSLAATIVGAGKTLGWFDAGDDLHINDWGVTLAGDPSLKISTKDSDDPNDYKDELLMSDYDVINQNVIFSPVSTVFKNDWIGSSTVNFVKEYKGEGNFLDKKSYQKNEYATKGFFLQDVWLVCNQTVNICINKDTFINADVPGNNAKVPGLRKPGKTDAEILDGLNSVAKCMRFLVYDGTNLYIFDPNKEEDTKLYGVVDLGNDKYYDHSMKSGLGDYEIVYGEYTNEDKLIYNLRSTDSSLSDPSQDPNTFNAKHKAGVQEVDFAASEANGFVGAIEDSISKDDLKDYYGMIKIEVDKKTHLQIGLYCEGWDLDNYNVNMSGCFNAMLKFNVTRKLPS